MENNSLYYLVLAFFMLRSNLWIFSTFVYTGCKDLIRSLLSSLHCIQSIQSLRFHGHVVSTASHGVHTVTVPVPVLFHF